MSSGLISISSAVSVLSRIRVEAARRPLPVPGNPSPISGNSRHFASSQQKAKQWNHNISRAGRDAQTSLDPTIVAIATDSIVPDRGPASAVIGSKNGAKTLDGKIFHAAQGEQTRGTISDILPSKYSNITAKRSAYRATKRCLDLIGALILLVLALPVFLVGALVVSRTPGPILLKQIRLTRGGRKFSMFKLRTMYADAEARSGAVWTQERDPRVIPGGHFLRRARIDELPQLLNVIRGEMSLIGPRPERPEFAGELARLYPSFTRRLEVDAGISGLAQVRSGYCASFDGYREKLLFDRLYVRHCSLWLDLAIGIKTIGVLVSGNGAR